MILPALSPGAQFSVLTLVYVKHRALPPLNIFFAGACSARYQIDERPERAVFLFSKNMRYDDFSMLQFSSAKEIGRLGEQIAANYFKARGWEVLEVNFENHLGYRLGEIDVVARDPKSNEIIFAEVKTRQKGTSNSEAPELAISRAKYRKLTKIISNYLRKNHLTDCNYRLDAIAIEVDIQTRKASLRHLKCIYY